MRIHITPTTYPKLMKRRHWFVFDGGSVVKHGWLNAVTLKEARTYTLAVKKETKSTMQLARRH